jgi:hypothetical protein
MKILAIDLGDTTGYVFLDDFEPMPMRYGTAPLVSLEEQLEAEGFNPNLVVIERPAYTTSPQQHLYSSVLTRLISRFREKATVIRATDWKQRFGRHPLPGRGLLKTQHEKDAYRIAVWARDKYGGQR